MLGATEARLHTPPLRELTPETSFGFEVVEFADQVLAHPLDPWQEWLVIHGGELLEDGRPRFRKLIILVSRQNGKTWLLVILALYWQFVLGVPMTLGTSTKIEYAKESWAKSVALAEQCPELDGLRPPTWKRETNGEQESWTTEAARYKIAASNRAGGRSLTVHRLILDELREHRDYGAWSASVPAMNAIPDAQAWAISNAGDEKSVVLNEQRDAALQHIETGQGDRRLGLFEWSCERDDDPEDVTALARANPNMGRRIAAEDLLADARTAVSRGGEALTTFRTENMCINVPRLDPAVDPGSWRSCSDPGDLSGVRGRVACCLDVAPDGEHATLVAAAVLADARVRVEVVKAWDDLDVLRRELPGLLTRVKPKKLGWFPSGPAAALAADLADRKGKTDWPPKGVTVDEIRGETSAVCMGLAEQVTAGQVAHSDDPLLTAHIEAAERLRRGDAWVFSRRGDGHVDAAYACAGAVHLARTMPKGPGKPRLRTVT